MNGLEYERVQRAGELDVDRRRLEGDQLDRLDIQSANAG